MTATYDQIVHHFLYEVLTEPRWQGWNWGCDPHERDENGLTFWDVDADTYINGVPLIMDADYMMGYLLEVVERGSSVVSYVAIAVFHGPHPETGHRQHDSMMHPDDAGTFFDRKVSPRDAAVWAVDVLEGFFQGHCERGC